MAWVRLPAGTDLRPGLVGLPGDLCRCPTGDTCSGRLVMHTEDGDSTYEAGQGLLLPHPGHAPQALEDCEYIDVSLTAELEEVIRHQQGGSA